MASEKKPSIYYDRSTIGSSNELDEYGVWVKSEPQDFSSENEGVSLSDPGDLPDFDIDSALADPEQDILFPDDQTFGESSPEDPAGDGSLTDDFDFSDLGSDPFGADSFPETGEAEKGFDFNELPEPEEITFPEEGDGDPQFDLSEVSPGNLFGSSLVGEAPPEGEGTPKGREASPAPAPDLSTQLLMKIAEELSSIRSELSNLKQEFRVLRREGPAEEGAESQGHGFFDEEDDEKISLTGDELDTILHTTDFTEESAGDSPAVLNPPEEPRDLSPEPLSGPEDAPETALFSEDAEVLTPIEEVPSMEETSAEELSEEPSVEDLFVEASPVEGDDFVFEENTNPAISMDDITIDLDLEMDQTSLDALNEADRFLENPEPEKELSLDPLDSGISGGADDSEELEILQEPEISEEGEIPEGVSIFQETGEEPDVSEGEGEELSFDLTPGEENAEFTLEPGEEVLNLNPEETAKLEMLMEEGLEPMTSPPEDTSYLDDDPLAENPFEEISLDLSDAVIDEPDLSGQIQENPPEEPALENIILDDLSVDELSEDISINFDTEEGEEEIEISLPEELPELEEPAEPAGILEEDEDFSRLIPEGFEGEGQDTPAAFEDDLEEEKIAEDAVPDILEGDLPGAEESLFDERIPEETEGDRAEDQNQNREGSYSAIPSGLQQELKTVLSYMDQLLESLPEEKIEEFAKSEYFDTYKKLFKELGLV
jgi:hypothetical protein